MMNRPTNSNTKEFVVVAWQDTDIADQIKDKSFGGKLAPKLLLNKENQDTTGNVDPKLVKKKRMSKKMSLLPSADNNDALSVSGLKLNDYDSTTLRVAELKSELSRISCHFSFGNATSADGLVNKTSNNKLDQSLRISYNEMCETLKSYHILHSDLIASLNKSFEVEFFPQWNRLMKFGFNILLHGVGSKKTLIKAFCAAYLQSSYYVELLGYHHDFNAKLLLKNILTDVLELNEVYKTVDEQLTAIEQNLKSKLFIVIHNIDGNCLRDTSIQYCLSELAANKYISIIASVDHINSSLLWDHMQNVSFKWIHFETNTLTPYNDEIMFENSLMLNQTANVQLSSMIHILKSLTHNAKNIFLVMVEYVLNPDNVKKSITFTKLYHECREKFFVSNEMTLRAQLTEFIDHKLIKLKAEADGHETVFLLIDEKNLKLYQQDLKDKV